MALAAISSALSFGVQQWSLGRYNLELELPEWLWVQLGVGWAFLLSGLAARRARPDSGIGTLMVAFGLIWMGRLVFTAPLTQWEAVGWAVALFGLLFVILYAFPDGRLRPWEKWATGSWLVFMTVITMWVVTLTDFYGAVDDSVCCPAHLLFMGENQDLQELLILVGYISASIVFTAVVVSQVIRWRQATPVGRRILVVPIAIVIEGAQELMSRRKWGADREDKDRSDGGHG